MTLESNIFLWDSSTKIIISDVDGTITKSDGRGQVMPTLGFQWVHRGEVDLFNQIFDNGYHILYLTARSIGMADKTRDYLFNYVRQNVGSSHEIKSLPHGPLLMSATSLWGALHREVIEKRPQVICKPSVFPFLFFASRILSDFLPLFIAFLALSAFCVLARISKYRL